MEIIIKETKEIVNTELSDCLNKVSELVINSKHNQKKIVDYLGKIVSKKMYETDFDSLKDFSNYIGLGQATLSQYKTFFAKVDVSLIYDCLPENDYSYTQIMESIKIIDKFDTPFLTGEILRDNGIYPSMSCKVSEDIEETESNKESGETESNKESVIIESYIDYLNGIETGTVIDDFDVKMFKNISSYLKGVIK